MTQTGGIVVERDVMMPARGGVLLATEIYRPDARGHFRFFSSAAGSIFFRGGAAFLWEALDQRSAFEHFKLARDRAREVRVGFRVAIGVWFGLTG